MKKILSDTLQLSTLTLGTIQWIPPISLSFITWEGVHAMRVQFPVPLSFVVTVHRSQGQTLNRAVFYLRRDVLMHGCVYVGLSRVRNYADIIILTTEDTIFSSSFVQIYPGARV